MAYRAILPVVFTLRLFLVRCASPELPSSSVSAVRAAPKPGPGDGRGAALNRRVGPGEDSPDRWKIRWQTLNGEPLAQSEWIRTVRQPTFRQLASDSLPVDQLTGGNFLPAAQLENHSSELRPVWALPLQPRHRKSAIAGGSSGDRQEEDFGEEPPLEEDLSPEAGPEVIDVKSPTSNSSSLGPILIINNSTAPQYIVVPSLGIVATTNSINSNKNQPQPPSTNAQPHPIGDNNSQLPKQDELSFSSRSQPLQLTDAEIDQYLSEHTFLREILGMLSTDVQAKRIVLLRENIKDRLAYAEALKLKQESMRLTNLGIGLHKQGQILDHIRQKETTAAPLPLKRRTTVSSSRSNSQKIQKLLQEKAQLERMMGQLVKVLEKDDQYSTFRELLGHQESLLNQDE